MIDRVQRVSFDLRYARRAAPLLLALTVISCAGPQGEAQPTEPPTGRWPLFELTGSIRRESGGPPVLCVQGETEDLPLPLYDPTVPVDSWIELADATHFQFSFAFEIDDDYEILTNSRGSRSASVRSRSPGSRQESVSVGGTWSWSEQHVEGTVESGFEENEQLRGLPRRTFTVEGRFEDPTHLVGTWSYQGASELASCWTRSRGVGTWIAKPGDGG